MSYLHCHKCHWSQDDFWNWTIEWKRLFKWGSRPFGYNPLSLILEDIYCDWKPRFVEMDIGWMRDWGYKGTKIHSWTLLWKHGILRHVKRIFTQKWWTYESFKKDKEKGVAACPKCKSSEHFDID